MRIPGFKGLPAQRMRMPILTRLTLFLKSCPFSDIKIGLSAAQLRSALVHVAILSVQLVI